MSQLLPQCACGHPRSVHVPPIHGIDVEQCTCCGIIRQSLRMTPAELDRWYAESYYAGTYGHTKEHDRAVAKTRLRTYQFAPQTRLLDIGAGNGAFVEEARQHAMDAWGQDLAEQSDSECVYVGALESINFPTDDFDVITIHDVLEHVLDPVALLREAKRVLRRPGKIIIDFPRFWDDAGRHHWKRVEHLWMFTEEQLRNVCKRAGLTVTASYSPIPSKIVFECERVAERRPQILVPPGIGDAWWALTKLPGLLAEKGLGTPDVWVQDAGGPKRTYPFIRCFRDVHAAGYKVLSDKSPLFREAYVQNARTVFSNVADVDYFVAYNGVMRAGRSLDEVDPQYRPEWRPRFFISKEALECQERMRAMAGGDYIVTFFAEAGMYRAWLSQFDQYKIEAALLDIEAATGKRIVMMGARWDLGQVGREIVDRQPNWINMISATTFEQMVGMLRGASAVVGFPAGNTMLATMFNVPTVLLWNEYFDRGFWTNSVPPDANYTAVDTRNLEVGKFSQLVQERLDGYHAATV